MYDENHDSPDSNPSMDSSDPVPPDGPIPPPFAASEKTKAWLSERLSERMKSVKILGFLEWTSKALQKKGASFFGRLLTLLLCTFFLSNGVALLLGNKIIPEPPMVLPFSSGTPRRFKTVDDYAIIFSRNLFNKKGLIPGEEAPTGGGAQDLGGAPVRTTLPFNLIGTLILEDERRSIATIEDKTASMVYPVQVDDEIPSKAKILKIEFNQVIFINTASGRREFVDLPEDLLSNNPKITLGSRSKTGGTIEQVAPNAFVIPKAEIDKAMGDINNILTQARAVPNFENGTPNGYKLFQIVPGSIYAKLGFQNGDVVTSLDGEPANDPGKALGALQGLKEKKHFEIAGKRDGRPFNYSYDFQ